MAREVKVEHAVTITEGGILFTENDVVVRASVCGDGEVLINEVSYTAVPLDLEARRRGRAWPVVSMTNSLNPDMQRAAIWFAEILLDDPDFIAKAQEAAGLHYVGKGPNDPDGRMEWEAA